jgi:hypothetical protein
MSIVYKNAAKHCIGDLEIKGSKKLLAKIMLKWEQEGFLKQMLKDQ